jgi:hypothetical protein
MITTDKIIEIFCISDVFCKEYEFSLSSSPVLPYGVINMPFT